MGLPRVFPVIHRQTIVMAIPMPKSAASKLSTQSRYDSTMNTSLEPDIAEDIRRLHEFERTGEAIPLDEVKAWIESWGSDQELPRPKPRKIS
jgi:hypothetical protein